MEGKETRDPERGRRARRVGGWVELRQAQRHRSSNCHHAPILSIRQPWFALITTTSVRHSANGYTSIAKAILPFLLRCAQCSETACSPQLQGHLSPANIRPRPAILGERPVRASITRRESTPRHSWRAPSRRASRAGPRSR